ncbi:hypothetical protein FTN_1102 [Francisella tularensis subsp. novicida U112]|uniref:Uncharacterized protein n=1 Tax=Francisella tularensis subsp. novicida (strain ATCC 15482 / CCUG 33449 / U112) TaxID=401614 RepID=A0Q6X3_FRATN|nr:hypothetical protein FTN_1102 [Francisella tularensis subsp. novicida U112]
MITLFYYAYINSSLRTVTCQYSNTRYYYNRDQKLLFYYYHIIHTPILRSYYRFSYIKVILNEMAKPRCFSRLRSQP